MLRKLTFGVLLVTATFSARAVEYTDVYYNPAESGWGFFVVQSNIFQFLAFFIYGSDGKPTWYTAQLMDNGTGTYTGQVYETTGTYFPLPWNPATQVAFRTGFFLRVSASPRQAYRQPHEPMPTSPLDFAGLRTVSLAERGGKVKAADFAVAYQAGSGLAAWLESLPHILAGDSFRAVISAIESAARTVAPFYGAWVDTW